MVEQLGVLLGGYRIWIFNLYVSMNAFYLGQRVMYKSMDCIVTNASIARGKKYEVSPVGRNQYFVVGYWEIENPKTTYNGQPRKEEGTN